MFNWAKQTLANVAGTQEPIYGPSAIRSVAQEAESVPYTELKREDLNWKALGTTCVETKTFYFMSDSGQLGMCQIIYSNVAGLHTTCQFVSKLFYRDGSKPHLWCSTKLDNVDFNEDKSAFYADNVAMELSEDGTTYTIKSLSDEKCIVNMKVTRKTPGFHAGKTGKTLFGTDLENPWGSMRHAFWPRCSAEGTLTTADGAIDFTGKAFFVHALQGMKPHHAAARWNFANWQGPQHSAMVMEFTTPASYGSTTVAVGAITQDGEIVTAGCKASVEHIKIKDDTENDWPEPTHAKFTWGGKTKDNKAVDAVMEGPLEDRMDRIDVMAEVPGFIKSIVATAAGTKPYIYQYSPTQHKMTLKLKVGDKEMSEEGELFTEATFIVA